MGSDGNLWFTYFGEVVGGGTCCLGLNLGIGTMSTSGVASTYSFGYGVNSGLAVSGPSAKPHEPVNIVGAPPGSPVAAWFIDLNLQQIGSVATDGAASLDYPLPTLCGGGKSVLLSLISDGSTGYWILVACSSGSQLLHMNSSGSIGIVNSSDGEFSGFTVGPSLNYAPNELIERPLWLGKSGELYIAGEDVASGYGAVLQVPVSGGQISGPAAEAISTSPPFATLAQSADGDLWITRHISSNQVPASVLRLHPAKSFAHSTYTDIGATYAFATPTGIVPLPDDSLWIVSEYQPIVYQVIPSPNLGAPTIKPFVLSSGSPWHTAGGIVGTLGPDGYPYFFDRLFSTYGDHASGPVYRIAY